MRIKDTDLFVFRRSVVSFPVKSDMFSCIKITGGRERERDMKIENGLNLLSYQWFFPRLNYIISTSLEGVVWWQLLGEERLSWPKFLSCLKLWRDKINNGHSLSRFGAIFNLARLVLDDFRGGFEKGPWWQRLFNGYTITTWMVVLNLGCSGLLVSWLMKYADNIVKVIPFILL